MVIKSVPQSLVEFLIYFHELCICNFSWAEKLLKNRVLFVKDWKFWGISGFILILLAKGEPFYYIRKFQSYSILNICPFIELFYCLFSWVNWRETKGLTPPSNSVFFFFLMFESAVKWWWINCGSIWSTNFHVYNDFDAQDKLNTTYLYNILNRINWKLEGENDIRESEELKEERCR